MRRFIWKGIVRDKNRSLLPVIVVAIGVFVMVFFDGFAGGMVGNIMDMTARYQSGHVSIATRAYEKNEEQMPLDLALLDVDMLLEELSADFPEVDWNSRISFGGLLDIPDENGETKAQGPVMASAYDLLSNGSREAQRLDLEKAIIEGTAIAHPMEILISADFADKFEVHPGDTITFFGSTMYGSMSFTNLTVAGVVRFGMNALDRGAIIIDVADARQILDMENAANEILGFLPDDEYDDAAAEAIKMAFNAKYEESEDEYAPLMRQLADRNSMRETMDYLKSMTGILMALLILALSIVLWNAGVLGGIRRYNEFGVRLALGENKSHIYASLITESLFIGIIGSVIGTAVGLSLSLFLKNYGIDYSSIMDNVSLMIEPVIRSEISPRMFYLGFIPGIISTIIGTALAGIAVYKRNTAILFKELG
jgi:ABC-type transport system, involved in lipoprotein release, permease component